MAMIFMDGFDANDLTAKWTNSNNTSSNTTTRFGVGRSQYIGYTGWITKYLPVASSKLFLGFGMRCEVNSAGRKIVSLYGDGGLTQHLRLELANDTAFRISRGDNTVLAIAANGTHIPNTWEYVEIMATVADSGGRITVRVNGAVVIDYTGDTKNGGTVAALDTMRFNSLGVNDGAYDLYLDDLYVLNDTGTSNNTFLGDVRIHTLPVTGPGTDAQFTPTGVANNWENVNELPMSATDYNSSSTVGQRDTYTYQDLPAGTGTVYNVQTNITLGKTDAGTAMMKPAIRSGGNVFYDSTINLSPSAVMYSIPHDVDPATSSQWTVSSVNSLETGAEVA